VRQLEVGRIGLGWMGEGGVDAVVSRQVTNSMIQSDESMEQYLDASEDAGDPNGSIDCRGG
jgi:hypothetical protein